MPRQSSGKSASGRLEFLGGAAVYRCDSGPLMTALAAAGLHRITTAAQPMKLIEENELPATGFYGSLQHYRF
jgi:hypothetical protein